MAGLGVQPVEGRFDAAYFDGDPAGTKVGVFDGDPLNHSTVQIPIPNVLFKRTPPSQFVRRP